MGILKFAVGANYKGFYEKLKEIAAERRKNGEKGHGAPLMFCDAVLSTILFGSGLQDYLNYRFYLRSFSEKKEYVTIRTQNSFYAKVCPAEYKKVFSYKPEFHRVFAAYAKRQYFDPETGSDEELAAFLEKNPVLVEKPVDGLGGRGVVKRRAEEVGEAPAYHKFLRENRRFIEEVIPQHEKMAALCDRSVNTIRVMTSTTGEEPKIIFVGLRVGNGEADIDNFHGGGLGVLVDEETGVLIGDAFDKELNRFPTHPKSGVKFDGYALPCWEEIRALVLEAAKVEPHIMVTGWDVAVTPEGPLFVEGNRRPGFDLPQVACGRGRKDIVRTALAEWKKKKKKK